MVISGTASSALSLPDTETGGIAAVVAVKPGVAMLLLAQVVAVITPWSAPLLATAVVGSGLATGLPKGAGASARPAMPVNTGVVATAVGGTSLSDTGSPLQQRHQVSVIEEERPQLA